MSLIKEGSFVPEAAIEQEKSLIGHTVHLVEMRLPKPWDSKPITRVALGIWERNAEGEDGKVEVFVPGHSTSWRYALGAEFGISPDGFRQTKIVLEPGCAQYIRSYEYFG